MKTNEQIKAKWAPLLENKELGVVTDSYKKRVTAQLLENTQNYINESAAAHAGGQFLTETQTTTSIDIQDPILINLVRRTAPNLLAYDLVGVQPMKGPTGLVFAMRAHYGAPPVGNFGTPGDARTGNHTGNTPDTAGDTTAQQWEIAGKAPNETFYNEVNTVNSGTGTQTSNATAPDYTAYSVGTGFATGVGETMGRGLSGDADFNEMSFTIEKTSVEAKERALKADYTFELAQDLRATHGLDAEQELSNILSTEILAEINREITNTIRKVAKIAPAELTYENGVPVVDSNNAQVLGTTGLFDIDANSDGRWQAEKFKSLLFKINKEANAIAKDTRRGRGNFLVVSSNVASALDLAGKLAYSPGVDNSLAVDDTGNTFVGTLQGRFKTYIDPYLGYDEVIVGFKGANQMDAGFFYCPYVPLQMYKALSAKTFQPAMAFKTRYGIKENPFTTLNRNGNSYYRKFKVQGL